MLSLTGEIVKFGEEMKMQGYTWLVNLRKEDLEAIEKIKQRYGEVKITPSYDPDTNDLKINASNEVGVFVPAISLFYIVGD